MHAPRPSHAPEFKRLAQYIRDDAAGAPLVFCPSPGNWGDSLINAGSRAFLAHHGFAYVELRREQILDHPDLASCHVLVGGGGGWCEFWHTTPELVSSLAPQVRSMTVLPTTFGEPPTQPEPTEGVRLFARDDSYSLDNRPDAIFCHDMAFHLSPDPVDDPSSGNHLSAFRIDKERDQASARSEDPANRDLSLEGNGFSASSGFYDRLREFDSLDTDRLHVAIAGAQLGLDVTLYPSAYPKIESVYRSSLEGTFPNVGIHSHEGPVR